MIISIIFHCILVQIIALTFTSCEQANGDVHFAINCTTDCGFIKIQVNDHLVEDLENFQQSVFPVSLLECGANINYTNITKSVKVDFPMTKRIMNSSLFTVECSATDWSNIYSAASPSHRFTTMQTLCHPHMTT